MWFYLTSWLLLSVKNVAEISKKKKKTVGGYNSTRETILFPVKYIVNIIKIAWHAASLATPLFIRIRWPIETDERRSGRYSLAIAMVKRTWCTSLTIRQDIHQD